MGPRRGWHLFSPILAGATAGDRMRACTGVAVAIALVGVLGDIVPGHGDAALWIVASMGASAVLVFVVPTSPMAQPWPTVGGNAISALIGVAVGRALGHGALACGLAVALAIAAMSLTRSLHPPGGATALTAVLGGSVASAGWLFPLNPVAIDALALVAVGWAFHRLTGHAYPHVAPESTAIPVGASRAASSEDLDAVLAELGETFDISREDLQLLLGELEARVFAWDALPASATESDRPLAGSWR
ncbi:MAG TPA: HPP family protein [Conexibacter sp.]|nr:HPP family protein [Conexibacter sp.]